MADTSQNSLSLLYAIGRQLVSTLDLQEVLARVVTSAVEYAGAERGMLIVLGESLQPELAAVVYQGRLLPYSQEEASRIVQEGLAGWVLRRRTAALVPDTSLDPRWLHRPDDDPTQSGPKSAICTPILVRGDLLVGVITIVHPQPGHLSETHLQLLQAVADQAAVAIYNARLYRSLEQAHQRYRELFEASIDPILISDLTGRIVEANRSATQASGYPTPELLHMRIAELHTVRWDVVGESYQQLGVGDHTVRYESELFCREEGKKMPVEVHARRVQIGGMDHIQWVFHDLSERKELETLQDELLAMIYHDLRSPLSNVVSSLDIIKAMLPEDQVSALEPLVGIALRSIDRVKRLANSLLDINRLEAGQRLTDLKEVRLQRLVEEAVETVGPNADAKSLAVRTKLPPHLPSLFVDEDMIRRVLINLLENAVKFTPSHGQITVGASAGEGQVQVWVTDTGAGIPPEARERIFEKFTRLRVENAPRGIGLGLAFCRLAIQAHAGRIWVEENPPNGSRFCFTLPVQAGRVPHG